MTNRPHDSGSITIDQLVNREVHQCLSALVSVLAQGYGAATAAPDLEDLCEQAAELCYPVDDYEEAAVAAGWEQQEGGSWERGVQDGEYAPEFTTAQEACEHDDIEPYAREHWAVSQWLAEKLQAKGERVDTDFAGMCVWGRTTTGQGIAQDGVIEEIYQELIKS